MTEWIKGMSSVNLVSVLLVLIVVFCLLQGISRGASASTRQLLHIFMQGVTAVIGLLLSWQLASYSSPLFKHWLISLNIQIPHHKLDFYHQLYYTIVTGVRDFSLLRFGLLFLVGYGLVKLILDQIGFLWLSRTHFLRKLSWDSGRTSFLSGLAGGAIGTVIGAGRALMLLVVLFAYTTLFPAAPYTNYIQASSLYQAGATQVIQPLAGDFISNELPVLTQTVADQWSNILQRKYEVLDANIPDNIAEAAHNITRGASTDEEKAYSLYHWVGTRVQYDWNKVKLYEEQAIWMEQSPEDTFKTRTGVCIDYSRLFAVMARSVGLEVKVETGRGYDGQGGYGSHAWNVVYLLEQKTWIPLDTTWVASGDNWFNPPHFYQTHVKEA